MVGAENRGSQGPRYPVHQFCSICTNVSRDYRSICFLLLSQSYQKRQMNFFHLQADGCIFLHIHCICIQENYLSLFSGLLKKTSKLSEETSTETSTEIWCSFAVQCILFNGVYIKREDIFFSSSGEREAESVLSKQ